MSFDFDQPTYKELKKIILSPERAYLVPYIGAGLSRYGPPDVRLPTWGGLVELLFEKAKENPHFCDVAQKKIKGLIDDYKYPEALGILRATGGRTWFGRSVDELLDVKAEGISPAAVALMSIHWTLVVTTNLDRMLEKAHQRISEIHPEETKKLEVFTHKQEQQFTSAMRIEKAAKTFLAKIHGTVGDWDSFVLAAKEYEILLANDVYRFIMEKLFRRCLIIIGFSVDDHDFNRALDDVTSHFVNDRYPPFLIVSDRIFSSKNSKLALRISYLQESCGLKLITYKEEQRVSINDPWGGHKQLFTCLDDLQSTWHEHYRNFSQYGGALVDDRHFVGRNRELAKLDRHILANLDPFQGTNQQNLGPICEVIAIGGQGKTTLVAHWIASRRDQLISLGIRSAFVFKCYTDSSSQFFRTALRKVKGEIVSLSTNEMMFELLECQYEQPTIFIFDGFEVFQKSKPPYAIRDERMRKFIDGLRINGLPVIITSRKPVPGFDELNQIQLKSLEEEDVSTLIKSLNLNYVHPADVKYIVENRSGHAQSIRILLSALKNNGSLRIQLSEEKTKNRLISIQNNPVRETLEHLIKSLNRDWVAVLKICCVFERPFSIALVGELSKSSTDFEDTIHQNLNESALYTIFNELIKLQLIIEIPDDYSFALHPNIRDFFRQRNKGLKPLYSRLYEQNNSQLVSEKLESAEEAEDFILTAIYAAKAGRWTEFDHLYRNRIMQGQKDFLCDSLGMWSESLELTKCAFPDGSPNSRAPANQAYYSSRYARSLKHLGYGSEATLAYDLCLGYCAEEKWDKTAIYLNNYLTLQIYMGHLTKALKMAPWNFATFQWLDQDFGVRNQLEHGGYSLGWLSMLMGDLDTAKELYQIANDAWNNYQGQRGVYSIYYDLYFVEANLIQGSPISEITAILKNSAKLVDEHGWQETKVRCLIFRSMLLRHEARESDAFENVERGIAECKKAERALRAVFAPPVEIELALEKLSLYFEYDDFENFPFNYSELIKRLGELIHNMSWGLYKPEYKAFLGLYSLKNGNIGQAFNLLESAEIEAKKQGNILALLSPYRSISMLRQRLNVNVELDFRQYSGKLSKLTNVGYKKINTKLLQRAISDNFQTQPSPKKQ